MKNRSGFTLIELVVALAMSCFVVVGLVGVTSQMARYQMETTRKSNNTSGETASVEQVVQDLQQASAVYCPSVCTGAGAPLASCTQSTGCGTTTSNYLSGCTNYSFQPGIPASMNPSPGFTVKAFYYCVWSPAANQYWLLRYAANGSCPFNPTPTCGATAGYTVVAQNVYPIGSNNYYFQRANDVNGVQLLFQVGSTTGTAGNTVLTTTTDQILNTKIPIKKTYNDNYD
jgi:prepilin-type N-terminal cleavage/methylation domain-containing protein